MAEPAIEASMDESDHSQNKYEGKDQPSEPPAERLPASEEEIWWSEAEVTRLRRKLDMRIIPCLFLTYLVAALDRSNIGNASVAGLNTDLHLSDSQYQWLLTIFYIPYICFQFLLLAYKVIRPSVFMGSCVFLWGTCAILQASAFNWSGLMAARFFIGMSESGYATGASLYLTTIYPRNEMGFRWGFFVVGSAAASAIAGALAYGLQQAHTAIESWQLIFIVEGSLTFPVALLVFMILPDRLATSRFLTPREQAIAEARLYRSTIDQRKVPSNNEKTFNETPSFLGKIRHNAWTEELKSSFDIKNGLEGFKNPLLYVNAAIFFIVNVSYSSIPVYLPTIIKGLGFAGLKANGFSAPPNAGALVLGLFLTYMADKTKICGCYLAGVTGMSAIGYVLLATLTNDHARYGAVWLVTLGLFSMIPLLYMWLIINTAGDTKRGFSLTVFATIGQTGPLLGTRLFPAHEGPYYRRGMWTSAGLIIAGFVLICSELAYLAWLNRRKALAMRLAAAGQEQEKSGNLNVELPLQIEGELDMEAKKPEMITTHAPLRYKSDLNEGISEERQELHRRMLDIALHRERSMYWYYSL